MTRAYGADALPRAQPLYSIGKCQEELGDIAGAERSYQASLELIEKHGAPNDPTLAYPLIRLSAIALDAGQHAEALARAERALEVQADGEAQLRADAKAAVAKALWVSGKDMARARSLADEAVAMYRELGKGADSQRERLEAWRKQHRL